METVILSREQFADPTYLPLFDKDIIISISGDVSEIPRCLAPANSSMRLNVIFDDVLDSGQFKKVISSDDATKIVNFIQEVLPWSDRLIIHCGAGLSRSPGVAIGLARYFNIGISENELRDKYPYFNIIVASAIWRICENLGLEIAL